MSISGGYAKRMELLPELQKYRENLVLYLPFDGTTPGYTNYDVNLLGYGYNRDAIVPVVATGGLIGLDGKFDKAVQFGRAATNLFENQTAETTTPYCSPVGAGA